MFLHFLHYFEYFTIDKEFTVMGIKYTFSFFSGDNKDNKYQNDQLMPDRLKFVYVLTVARKWKTSFTDIFPNFGPRQQIS